MDNNIEIKEEHQCQNGASAAVKSENSLSLDAWSQNKIFAVLSDETTESITPSQVANKMEVKEDPWSQNGPLVAIKTEHEDQPVSDARVHNETVYVSVSNTVVHSDEETDVKLEVKEEVCWHEVSCKSEKNSDANEIEMKESVADTEEILGDVPGVAPRLSTKLICRNSDSATRRKNSLLERGNSDTKTTDLFNSTETHIEDIKINNVLSSDVETGSLINNNKNTYKCEICGASFVSVSNLNRHQLTHGGQRKHRCHICEKSFTRASGLKEHKLIHDGIRPYKCEVCEKAFINTSTLKVHKLIHEGKRPHKCNVCEKTFTSSSNLKVHKLLHEGRRPHKCEVCEKTFIHATTYKNHKLIHEGKRPYVCSICMKTFKRSSHLKKHCALIHEGKRPYTCSVCEKSFQQSSHLNQHYAIKHEGKRSYVCKICGKSYTRAAHLKRHTLIIHGQALTEISTQP